jgi:hypothetical protein
MDWISIKQSQATSEADARRMLQDLFGRIEDLAMSEYRLGAAKR